MNIPQLPFTRDSENKVTLNGCCLLSCGCGNVIARWANIRQNLVTKIPQGKPKSSRIIYDWIEQNKLLEKWPILKQHQYGIVVGETENGFEMINIMSGATPKVAEQIGSLIRRNKEWTANQ